MGAELSDQLFAQNKSFFFSTFLIYVCLCFVGECGCICMISLCVADNQCVISLTQRFSIQVLTPPQLCIFCMSPFVNTPDSGNLLVKNALHA